MSVFHGAITKLGRSAELHCRKGWQAFCVFALEVGAMIRPLWYRMWLKFDKYIEHTVEPIYCQRVCVCARVCVSRDLTEGMMVCWLEISDVYMCEMECVHTL